MSEAEDIARRFEQRIGFELIDFAPVALPMYRLTVDAVTMVHRGIPPIKEFVMRSLASGLSHPDEIAGFLGLDSSIVNSTVEQIISDRYATDSEEGTVTLSDRGQDVLSEARESSPQDEMLVFLYDRLLCHPVRLAPDQVVTPALVDAQRVIEIRPYPAEGPEVDQLSMPDVLQVLEQQGGGRQAFGRDLLRIKRIVRRVRLFRPAVALVFRKLRSSDIHIDFIVDGARHETLSNVFAERGGPKKMGFIKSISESSANAELRRYLGSDVQKLLPAPSDLDGRRVAVSTARIKHQAAVARLGRAASLIDSSEIAQLKEAASAAATKLAEAEQQLRVFPARPVAPFELPELLDRALGEANQLLMISSRTLENSLVDATFLKRIVEVLDRGAQVVISLSEKAPTAGAAIDLERARARYARLELIDDRPSQTYHLVCDASFAVVTNRPFLS
ncbi:hypothetical protein WDZ92_36550, partial [Nostoc sp. NIES-2111]